MPRVTAYCRTCETKFFISEKSLGKYHLCEECKEFVLVSRLETLPDKKIVKSNVFSNDVYNAIVDELHKHSDQIYCDKDHILTELMSFFEVKKNEEFQERLKKKFNEMLGILKLRNIIEVYPKSRDSRWIRLNKSFKYNSSLADTSNLENEMKDTKSKSIQDYNDFDREFENLTSPKIPPLPDPIADHEIEEIEYEKNQDGNENINIAEIDTEQNDQIEVFNRKEKEQDEDYLPTSNQNININKSSEGFDILTFLHNSYTCENSFESKLIFNELQLKFSKEIEVSICLLTNNILFIKAYVHYKENTEGNLLKLFAESGFNCTLGIGTYKQIPYYILKKEIPLNKNSTIEIKKAVGQVILEAKKVIEEIMEASNKDFKVHNDHANSSFSFDPPQECIDLNKTFKDEIIKKTQKNYLEKGIDLKKELENFEKSLILSALEQINWNKSKAAKLLGLNRTTFVEKIKSLKIEYQYRVAKLLLPTLPENGIDLKKELENFENRCIWDAMKKAGYVKKKASKLLGLNRTTLVEKIKRLRNKE